jgi:hypothetical protein
MAGASAWALMQLRPEVARGQGGTAIPRRVIFFYAPNGVFHDLWRPRAAWTDAQRNMPMAAPLSGVAFGDKRNVLAPLFTDPKYAPIRGDLMILDGVHMRSATDSNPGDDHARGESACLSGCGPSTKRNDFTDEVVSLDRYLARNLFAGGLPGGVITPAMELAVSSRIQSYGGIFHGTGIGGADHHTSPSSAWKRLFGDVPSMGAEPAQGRSSQEREASVLFQKEREISQLKTLLGKEEASILDEHLAAIRSYKEGIANQSKIIEGCQDMAKPDDAAWLPNGVRFNHLEAIGNSYMDLLVQGMVCDRVRIATLAWIQSVTNNMHCTWLGAGFRHSYHHNISHGGGPNGDGDKVIGDQIPADRLDDVRETTYQFWVKQFGNLLLKLKNAQPGGRPLLDSTTVVVVTDMSDGQHSFGTAPFFVGGGGGVRADGKTVFDTGRYVKFVDRAHNDLLISVAHAMGLEQAKRLNGTVAPLTQFGAANWSKGPLTELFRG